MAFRLDIDWLTQDINGEIKTKYEKQCHVLSYASSTDLDQLQNVKELVVKALHNDDNVYKTLQYVLNNSSPKSLEIQWREQEQTLFEQQWITLEQMQLLADSLSSNKTLHSFIFNDGKISYMQNKQSMKILAEGINRSNLKFVGFVNTPEFTLDTLYDTLSTNTTLRQFYMKSLIGLGSHLDKFVLLSSITKLHLIQTVVNDSAITSISNILCNTETLETFELRNFELRTFFNNFGEICTGVAENRTLKTLIIGSKCLTVEDNIKPLISALKNHPTIETLNIEGIDGNGFDLITKDLLENDNTLISLAINKTTRNRDIYYDRPDPDPKLTNQSLRSFAEKLAANTKLQHLFLGIFDVQLVEFNNAEAELLNALKLNQTLLTLDLPVSNSNIMSTESMIDLLKDNTTLTRLNLQQVQVPDLTIFFNALRQNKSLTSLDISRICYLRSHEHNKKYEDLIHDLISQSKTLKELKCSSDRANYYCYSISKLLSAIKYNESLTSVELFMTGQTRELLDFNSVADAFSVNKTLTDLNTNIHEKILIEPYLKRNRQYQLEGIILLYNATRSSSSMFPNEIWLSIFQHLFAKAIDVVFYGRNNKLS